MWVTKIKYEDIKRDQPWKVEFYCEDDSITLDTSYERIKIRNLVKVRKETVDPQENPNEIVNYIGLKNVMPIVGVIVDFDSQSSGNIKSRSKRFNKNDILFGRLRPTLNKVYLADEPVEKGICSNEFIVLKPDTTQVSPQFFRTLLSSTFVQKHVGRLQTGSALPRLNVKGFLNIEVPIPPLEEQVICEGQIKKFLNEFGEAYKQYKDMPKLMLGEFTRFLTNTV